MKWGVRRFQDEKGRLTTNGESRYNDNIREQERKEKFRLSDKQKKAIKIGAVLAASALVVCGGYYLHKSGKLDGLINKGKSSLVGKGIEIDKPQIPFKKLTKRESIEEAISKVNPNGDRNNCFNCVVATVGRTCGEGLDVVAKPNTMGGKGLNFEEVCRVFKLGHNDIKPMSEPNVEKMTKYIGRKYSEGDIGAITVAWNDDYKKRAGIELSSDAAHTLNWIIRNGKVEFVDGQINKSDNIMRKVIQNNINSNKEAVIAKFANINEDIDVDLELFKKFVD